jgi:hypothetical protein
LGERIVQNLSKKGGYLARAQIKENVVVRKLRVEILPYLQVVLVIRVAHPALVDGWTEVNLGGNFVEAVQILDLVVVG